MDSDGLSPVKVKICLHFFKSDMKAKLNSLSFTKLLLVSVTHNSFFCLCLSRDIERS